MNTMHKSDVERGERFEFGANWANYLSSLTDQQIFRATKSLNTMLEVDSLSGKKFLDIGSGSGLFSLAARKLGAKVLSFDYDPKSVACTNELKNRYFENDVDWTVQQGSILDKSYVKKLGKYDVVYSWGVLHHTGHMWEALENAGSLVAKEGIMFIAIYNKQQFYSPIWSIIKKTYNKSGLIIRRIMEIFFYIFFVSQLFIADLLRKINPLKRYRPGNSQRGMNLYHDTVDWVGGWPFEVATPDDIFQFFKERGFVLINLKTCGAKHGCNEFVFKKMNSLS